MSTVSHFLISKSGKFFVVYDYGGGSLKQKELTLKQFIRAVREEVLAPVYSEVA